MCTISVAPMQFVAHFSQTAIEIVRVQHRLVNTNSRRQTIESSSSISADKNVWSRFTCERAAGVERSLFMARLFDFDRVNVSLALRELAGEDDPFLVGRDVDVRLDSAAAGHVGVPRHF